MYSDRDISNKDAQGRLLGEVVERIEVSEGEACLRLTFKDGCIAIFATEGDCCSDSWWADICDVSALVGGRLIAVEQIPLPAPADSRTRQEVDEAYGVMFKTDRGTATAIYRNSSNGYYGGWCEVFFENDRFSTLKWRPVIEDGQLG